MSSAAAPGPALAGPYGLAAGVVVEGAVDGAAAAGGVAGGLAFDVRGGRGGSAAWT